MRTPRILVVDGAGELRLQVEQVTRALRPLPHVFELRGLEGLDGAVGEHGPFDVVLAGPQAGTTEGLRELRRLRPQIPQASVILALDRFRSGSLRETIRTGAVDMLRLPVDDDVLLDAIEQALEVRWAAPVQVSEDAAVPVTHGRVVAVVSATGGCGKTFFSTNLAYHLQTRLERRTCVIDLDLQFGELSTALRLKPKSTIADLIGNEADSDLGGRLEDALMAHDSGIRILAAPEEPAHADGIDAGHVGAVIEAARARFDEVVIDTPASLSEAVLAGLQEADVIFAVATLDLPSVRNLGVLLTTLKDLKVPSEVVHLVLNKVERDVGIEVEAVSKHFPQGFSIVIPYGREVNRSLNMGMPMLAYAPRSEVSRTLEAGLMDTLGADDAEPEPVRDRRTGLLAWRRRRSA